MKRGPIKISDEMYRNEWPLIYIFFKDFRPTHIEFRHWEANTWYLYGESDLFDENIEGEAIPEYSVKFIRTEVTDKEDVITYKIEKA